MKRILHLTILCLLLSGGIGAQVTIGSGQKPNAGALLDLKDETAITAPAGGETAKKGLGLPRVELQAYDKLKMSATATEHTDKTAHVGLVVYNTNAAFDECEATSIPSGLHVWDGGKWVGMGTQEHKKPTPPDLSSPLYNPNAYMVTTIGSASSVTIPVAKAFAVWEYWASEAGGKKLVPTPFTGTLSVSVVWQEGMGQANNSIVGAPTLSSTNITDKTATITVPTTGNAGNAVISLSDGTGTSIRWSWHIWVTAAPATNAFNGLTWMDRNLGATSATPAADGTIGLNYQWGRHTPIPGYTKFTAPNTTTVAVVDTAIASALAADGNTPSAQNALAHAISKPLDFITNTRGSYDWYSNTNAQWDSRWAEQQNDVVCPAIAHDIPAITDPCPAGWKVPVGTNSHTTSPWAPLTLDNAGAWNQGYNWTNPAAPAGYYPAAGFRDYDGLLSRVGIYGHYWSASPGSSYARYLGFLSVSVDPWLSNYRAFGFSVRCVQ